ncbi:MAG: hypothetical protein N0E44_23100 [Candidatus Thiodiazotropha lotti]|nr:hypothetical protein [Candidatus Thiodiazotropha lotti]MCW4222757.1 hypothetical protein [Candidatus Thiodiazotropha lotti]
MMNKPKFYKYLFWLLIFVAVLINAEPAIQFGVMGQIPTTYLSPAWKPAWLYPSFGILSVFNVILLFLLAKNKTWAVWPLGAVAVPHSFAIYFIAERYIVAPAIYIVPTVIIICFYILIIRRQQLGNENT